MKKWEQLSEEEKELYNSVVNRKWDKVDDLINSGINSDIQGYNSKTFLHELFQSKKWDLVDKILRKSKINLNDYITRDGRTLLMLAAEGKELNITKLLIEEGMDINAVDSNGMTALMYSVRSGNKEITELLIDSGADIGFVTKESLLMHAIDGGNLDIIKLVLSKTDDINYTIDGKNALKIAVFKDNWDVVELLIDRNIKVTSVNNGIYNYINYFMTNDKINLLLKLLKQDACDGLIKSKIIRDLIISHRLEELLELAKNDRELLEYIVSDFFNADYDYKIKKEVLDIFFKFGMNQYIRKNFLDDMKSYLIDAYVHSENIKHIEYIEEELNIFDWLPTVDTDIETHINIIARSTDFKSLGERSTALGSCVLVKVIEKMFIYNVEDFYYDEEDIELLQIYQMIMSMKNVFIREKYKEFYFKKILNLEDELIEKIEGIVKKEGFLTEVYKKLTGGILLEQDGIYQMVKDINNLRDKHLVKYDVNELNLYNRSVDKKKVENVLDYVILAIKNLESIIIKERMINWEDIKNRIGFEEDPNMKILNNLFKEEELKIYVPKKSDSYNDFLNQEVMNWSIDNLFVIVRGFPKVYEHVQGTLHNETSLEIELRKGIRRKGYPTLTKSVGNKDGNQNRSFTMINFGSKLFAHVGFGVIGPDLRKISLVASNNAGTGKGKKDRLTRIMKYDPVIRREYTIEEKMSILFEHLKKGGGSLGHNEVVMDVMAEYDIDFVFFYDNGFEDLSMKKLKAVYCQRKYKQIVGEEIPIFRCSSNFHYPVKEDMTKEDVKTMLRDVFDYETSNILSRESIDFLMCFEEEIKDEEVCKYRAEQFIKNFRATNIFDVINISNAKKQYFSYEEQQKYLRENCEIFLNKDNFLAFMKSIKQKENARRINREVGFYFEVVDSIKKISDDELILKLRETLQDTFKAVCEYTIQNSRCRSIDTILQEFQKREWLGELDDSKRENLIKMKREKEKQIEDILKQYEIKL